VQLFASGGVAYAWFPTDSLSDAGIAAPIAAPTSSTWYTVYVTAENGCGRFDSVFVEVLDRCAGLLLPNAFTPDGDGRNDAFRIQPIGDDQLVEMTVFNRWGELIFQSANAEIGWDGTYRGKPQPLGVYLYVLRFRCDGADFQKSGTVTLLR
jgi:gliding motility-associated-like protein